MRTVLFPACFLLVHGFVLSAAPPLVRINYPHEGETFAAPATIHLAAYARDEEDRYDLKVEFFAGTNSLGFGTFVPALCPDPYCPYYALTWSNVPPGNYTLTAKATDSSNISTISEPVHIVVSTRTNLPPFVEITTPPNGALFPAPADVPICADARDLDGYVATVEFFAGTNSLGVTTNNPLGMGPMNPFCLVWSNVPPGEYVLRAKATDNQGAVGQSYPIRILVGKDLGMSVVSIRATDPHASEAPLNSNTDTARFTVYRTAPTNVALAVYYTIGGTASNGVDYVTISNAVVIPAGTYSADILIRPLGDNLTEPTESVVLTIPPIACIAIWPPPPECYHTGFPNSAVAFIEDNDRITNSPPKVRILWPTNGMVFSGPTNLEIRAEASDPDNEVVRVAFFAGQHMVGVDVGTNQSLYSVIWSNALPGLYSLHARAFDRLGAVGFSEPVRISILGSNLPPTNLPPVVTIFAVDALAGEGTNCWRWYSNTFNPTNFSLCTNNATFVVRRTGPTNSALTVHYAIGGSASNGVDYAAIANSVTIPAGERSARIQINPLDDALVECPETVILALVHPNNSLPAYLLGWPAKAAVTIVDNDRSPPGTTLLCDGTFHLCLRSTNGTRYRLECSLDLVHWLPLGTNTVSDNDIHFTDAESGEFPQRFFRVVPVPETAASE